MNGRTYAVDRQAPGRVNGRLSCPHRPPCPGCPRFGEPGIALSARALLGEFARLHGLPEPAVFGGASIGFRHRARLAIRGRLGAPKLGLFELGTHRVVHIPHCPVHHPLINRVATVVRRAIADAEVTSYSDRAHLGVARYLQVVVERSSQTAQVVLVANADTSASVAACLDLVRERLGADLHSLWFNANCGRANTILGSEFQAWCGPESVVERFGGAAIHYPPGAFGQNNLEVAGTIVDYVRAQIPDGASVAEFYAGVGAMGLSMLARVREIRLNELSPHSLRGLELGLGQLGPAERAKISLHPGPAGAACAASRGAEVVIADPPRKGLDPALTTYLAANPPERFVYVSCGLDSFLADAAQLTANGRLRLGACAVFDLLPYTDHVETVARFDRT